MACHRIRRAALFIVFACALGGLIGCAPPVADVSGTIKIKGQPANVKGLEILFLGADGRPASTPINSDGTYTIKDAPAGDTDICFVYTPPGVKGGKLKDHLTKPGGPKGVPVAEAANPIPEALRNTKTSKISFKIVPGQANVFDYDVRP